MWWWVEEWSVHLSCSRRPSSRLGTPGLPRPRSGSGRSNRRGEHTACCTCCCSSSRRSAPVCGRWCGPPLRRGWRSARVPRDPACPCEQCAQLAAPPRLQGKNIRSHQRHGCSAKRRHGVEVRRRRFAPSACRSLEESHGALMTNDDGSSQKLLESDINR